ncbi:MAG: YceI family protein [Proteobacteria bacterium]|uniref:YceI family protein n=1 Tax=Rudaea sp. TaxID=2136325 RepID=UPI0037850E22|nr:YceI family protein [Pseudomonadota bacterium]
MKRLILVALLFASIPAFAADGAKAPATAVAKYDIDPAHSNVTFGWNHFGFSNPTARLKTIEGSVLLDRADLTRSSVAVTLPLDGLDTGVAKLDEHLRSADFLDAAKYPTITFKSTKVEKAGDNGLTIAGELTVHGVTRPVTLNARINKIGLFEMGPYKVQAAGFDATTTIKRSEFGVDKYLPNVSDEIAVRITLDAKQAAAK